MKSFHIALLPLLFLSGFAGNSVANGIQDPRKCPAIGPATGNGQACGSLTTCGGMNLPTIAMNSCSTKNDGECEPSTLGCRWSCTFDIGNVVGAGPDLYACAAGAGVTAQDCKGGAKLIDPLDNSTWTISDSTVLACNTPGRFRFVFFNKDPQGSFVFGCCAQYNLECSTCD